MTTSIIPMRIDSYQTLIEERGGVVYEEFPTNPDILATTVLVTNVPARTEKYMRALLLGVPCISHEYIDHSISMGVPTEECTIENIGDQFYLPRGKKWPSEEDVPQLTLRQRREEGSTVPKPFIDMIAYLQGSKEFKHTWTRIIVDGGGKALSRYSKSGATKPTIVIGDEHTKPSQTTWNLVKELGIKRVTQSWVTEAIVRGRPNYSTNMYETRPDSQNE